MISSGSRIKKGSRWRRKSATSGWRLSAAGISRRFQELLNRTEGRAPQQIELTAELTHRDADLPAILAALGLGLGTETAAGPEQSGGTGGGPFEGPVDESAALEIAGSETDPVHRSGQAETEPAADDSLAAAPRKKRTNKQVLPGLAAGNESGLAALLISYASEFAATWGRKSRAVLRESGGHFGVGISSEANAADSWEIKDHLGGMATAGIRAEATGKGCQVLIIDDPVKNAEEANSAVIREKNWEIYVSTHYTRLEPGGGVIVIQTPWHEDDLQGRIQANAKTSGEQWDIIRMPALSEGADVDPLRRPAGEPLWPERYGRADFDRIKAVQGSYWFRQCSSVLRSQPTAAASSGAGSDIGSMTRQAFIDSVAALQAVLSGRSTADFF